MYITFLIAWIQGRGAGPDMVTGTWALMSVAVIASPFVWSRVLARSEGEAELDEAEAPDLHARADLSQRNRLIRALEIARTRLENHPGVSGHVWAM